MNKISQIRFMEDHDELYKIWKRNNFHHKIVVHFDAHIDYRTGDMNALHIGNYLSHAIRDGIIRKLYWVVPGTEESFLADIFELEKKLKVQGITGRFMYSPNSLEVKIESDVKLIVCPLSVLQKKLDDNCVLDIDLDFFMFTSALKADRLYHIGSRKPWITPKQFVSQIHNLKSSFISICYSVNGGWTPIKYKYIGDELALSLGIRSPDLITRIVAGKCFLSFDLLLRKGKYSEAKRLYTSSLLLNSHYYNFYTSYGPLYLLKGDLDKAKDEFKLLLTVDQYNIYSLFGLGMSYMLEGNFKKAKKYMLLISKMEINKDIIPFLIYIESKLNNQAQVKKLMNTYINYESSR